ncbi:MULTISPECIES: MFS transporter [Streptomyces]|uniref:MFS transporter n=1 Tax=Streptomyces TaxID=1883 RepID=UPI000A57FAF1|nr:MULTISPECIES: MFS transporter [Streptomyces]MCI4083331.1 MFS transporter [Streptomyces sp. MMS21 TC-5]QNE25671.1 MFS transporter [Streptomyces sp. INR7]RST08067.1 MFS transporter [Streptomyces sp. WAC05950]GLV93883.1 MFS transporter [Streptomyces lavendulae subsp. lavendulae]
MRRGGEIRKERRRGEREPGLLAQLRRPPGGRDARIMLLAQLLDRAGTGVWAAACVLYFTFVVGLDAGRLGILLGAAGVAGIAGSPLAGHLADRFPVRSLLIGAHLLRLVTLCLLLVVTDFALLLPVVAVTHLGDRAAKTLEMLFATRVAGERRATYQALSRSSANAGYALGAGLAAIGLAVGTRGAYHVLILANALSFLVAAVLVRRTREPRGRGLVAAPAAPAAPAAGAAPTEGPAASAGGGPGPWRDRGYLRFVLLDIPMNLDDSILAIGIPLWLVSHTTAPHELIPAFLVVNTVLVVVLQLRVSAKVQGPRRAAGAVALYGLTTLLCCVLLAASTGGGVWTASAALLAAAVLATAAELMRSVSSWELAVSLAPRQARASYLGVAGMAQSVQKSAGPLLLTGAVMAAGPAGWLVLGAAVAGLSLVQRRAAVRRLDLLAGTPAPAPAAAA